MATRQSESLRVLTAEEQATLVRRAPASSERVDWVRRATALLAVAQGRSFAHAARAAGFRGGTAVADLVGRFNRQGVAAVRIAAGRGRRPTYDGSARAQIVATAQRSPDRRADGTATWSLSTLERTPRREACPRLGATTIRRGLHDAGSSSQRSRTWCPTGTAQRKRKAGTVPVVDPRTEETRGGSIWPTAPRKRQAYRCGVTMKRVPTKRSRGPVPPGSPADSRCVSPTNPSAVARPNS